MLTRILRCSLLCVSFSLAFGSSYCAAQSIVDPTDTSTSGIGRLDVLQAQIDTAVNRRDQLRTMMRNADTSAMADLQLDIDNTIAELKALRISFEQSVIGLANVGIVANTSTEFDWRDEVTQILQPIVENLKILTEKPRKISRLQSIIEQNALRNAAMDSAINAIKTKTTTTTNPATLDSLAALEMTWSRKLADNLEELALANQQLSELQNSNVSWWQTISSALSEFFRGRGLTLFIAIAVAFLISVLMKGLLALFNRRSKKVDQEDFRTRRRLVQYAYRLLTFTLILIAVISVFYTRGDMLLMGLSILAAAGIALGLRQAIPKFLSEARLLLNIGSIRENERVIYKGLPWQVASLNIHSILSNPELTGVVRLPLSELSSMVSRPAGKEPWFPASRGDYILLEKGQLMLVTRLTPEIVELKDRAGTLISMPAAEFYSTTFKNLTRSESFGITTTFGIDYRHQSICLSEVPKRMKAAIDRVIADSDNADTLVETVVELQQAGSSSLDYLVYLKMRPEAAINYLKIERLLQQTCVSVCTTEGWNIPFPHLTIQKHST